MAASRQALLVLGMHRSGTSALAGFLVRLGARAPSSLMGSSPDNPLGHWESDAIYDFHERLLTSAGSGWDAWTRIDPEWLNSAAGLQFSDEVPALLEQEFGDAPLFVIKDPRMCRLVPFWLRTLQAQDIAPLPVLSLRSPLAVAHSLAARNHLGVERSLLIWMRHMLDAELHTRSVSRSFVRYHDLLKDWKAIAETIAADTGLKWPGRSAAAEDEIAGFLRPELCHHSAEIDEGRVPALLADWLQRSTRAFDLLTDSSSSGSTEGLRILDGVGLEFERAASVFGPVLEEVAGEVRRAAAEHEASLVDDLKLVNWRLQADRDNWRRLASERDATITEQKAKLAGLQQPASKPD